ncbi:MAG: response regulator transcription factor [Actinobacteria bacterium]|nr:response regulator transcription factor [Actinomycetota bacterium]
MSDVIRVALCDDHALVRSGLRRILTEEADIEVVGEAETAEEAVALAVAEQPDVFVMDLSLPGASGIEATRRIVAVSPQTKMLVLTGHDDVVHLRKAFEAGARGFLVKDIADLELVLAVRQVAAGNEYVHPRIGAALLNTSADHSRMEGPGGRLSERELAVLRLVVLGYTNPEIASELYVSVRTVETHRAHVQQKLGIKSRSDLVRYAREQGILDGAREGL